MKVIFLIVLLACLAVLSRYGLLYRTSAGLCNDSYQGSLDTLTAQSQTVLADRYGGCSASYGLLTDWDMCLARAETSTPMQLRPVLHPAVASIMLFFREKVKDMTMLKKEHDERCIGYTALLFFPPDAE